MKCVICTITSGISQLRKVPASTVSVRFGFCHIGTLNVAKLSPLAHLLAPGAYARMPLVDRVAALKIPVAFVYGDHDWMSADGGRDAVEIMRRAGNPDGRLHVVKDAGHHLYLDNPQAVNDLLLKELERPGTITAE